MTNDKTAHLLNEIGQLLAEDNEYPLDGTLLYAEVGDGYVAPSIFKDRGDHIVYRDPDLDRLGDALLDLWKAQDSAEPWREIEYVIRGGKFRASFNYPEDAGEEPFDLDRRETIVAKHFGDKPIRYPPMPDDPDIMRYKP